MDNQSIAIEYLIKLKECKFTGMSHPFSQSEQGMGYILIYMIDGRKNVTAKELSESMGVSMARITTLIQKMEDRKLVSRSASPTDGRVNYISLTESGTEEARKLVNRSIRIATKIIDEIGKDEVDHFIETAFRIKNIVEADEEIKEGEDLC